MSTHMTDFRHNEIRPAFAEGVGLAIMYAECCGQDTSEMWYWYNKHLGGVND